MQLVSLEALTPTSAPLVPSGIIFALDKDTGKKLWEFNVGTPIGIGGPSVGNGMLFVTTGQTFTIGQTQEEALLHLVYLKQNNRSNNNNNNDDNNYDISSNVSSSQD